MAKTILIIKLGYCETLVREEGFIPSLGDVFRHTVLLHRYRKDRVTWLTSTSAAPLLRNNPGIQELLLYEENIAARLAGREFDEVICLEKASVICKLAKSVKARKRFGFGRNGDQVDAHPLAQSALDIANGRNPFLPIQALLYQMVGDYWRGEDYLLAYSPRPHATYDVGFNYRVGDKWPTKAWPMKHWKALERLCDGADITVSWQEGERDIEHYMDWIHGGALIVTCDSLGMHLGLALKKQVVALFGSTPSEQIYMYGRGVIIRSDWACPQAPCMLSECKRGGTCMSEIKPESVFRIIQNLLGRSSMERLPTTDGWKKKPDALLPQTAGTS
jgi:heptosyltransferase-2